MNKSAKPHDDAAGRVILMVDDDPEDLLLASEAMRSINSTCELRTVESAAELMDYLRHQGAFSDPSSAPRPDLVLLDLNMPKTNGVEVLQAMRSDETFCDLTVVVFSTSSAGRDIRNAYRAGANSYISKPESFEDLCRAMRTLCSYWFGFAQIQRVQA